MKTTNVIATLTLAGLLVGAAGCSKTDETAQAPAPVVTPTTNAPPAPTGLKVDAAAADAKDTATKTADAVTKQSAATATSSESTAQGIIDKAKAMVADKQYQPALDSLQKLGSLKLTDDQQKSVDDLKAQIQKMIAGQAAGSLGGVLGK